MKQQFFSRILVGLSFIVSLNGTTLQAADAQERRFFCGVVQGQYTTLVRASQGTVPFIYWNSGYFAESGWTNKKRCIEVSQRFQRYSDQGKLNYIRTGVVNRYPVLCVEKCLKSEVLITLNPDSNPHQTLEELLSLRNRSRNLPLELSGEQALYYDDTGELYADVDKLLAILEPVLDKEVTSVDAPIQQPQDPLF